MTDWRTSLMMSAFGLSNEKVTEQIQYELENHSVGLIYLDIVKFGEMEQKYGRKTCDQVLRILQTRVGQLKRWDNIDVLTYQMVGDDFFIYVNLSPGEMKQQALSLKQGAEHLRKHLQNQLNHHIRLPHLPIELHIGTSLLYSTFDRSIESMMYNAIKQAIREAKSDINDDYFLQKNELMDILQHKKFSIYYQPIVSLTTANVFGYEALTRCEQNSLFPSPFELFQLAEQEGHLYWLETVTREQAIHGIGNIQLDQKVFLNINASVVNDPRFSSGQTVKLLQQKQLSPQNVVFEITERTSIEDFPTFKRVLEHYRRQGYRIAIDDAGAGYSSLQAIAELRPDYIKIDRSLITHIDQDKVKETMLEAFVQFARKMNCQIIAEGIETREELNKVIDLGVNLGQGYYLARPHREIIKMNSEVIENIMARQRLSLSSDSHPITIGSISRSIQTFSENTKVSEIAAFFNQYELEPGVVIANGMRPVGIVMREKLNQYLAAQYGVPLYWHRPVTHLMDGRPLVIEEHMDIETVSRLAMGRDFGRLYDFIVVARQGELVGIVTIQTVLDSMTNMKIEQARDLSPLTGLPGNKKIEQEIARYLSMEQPFSIIYADLDQFKQFNDQNGFHQGDKVLRFTAEVLQQALDEQEEHHFIGHIGGDDFVIILKKPEAVERCETIIKRFDQGIKDFFYENDLIDDGAVTISLSLLTCKNENPNSNTYERIAHLSAILKKQAKSIEGSVYIQGFC